MKELNEKDLNQAAGGATILAGSEAPVSGSEAPVSGSEAPVMGGEPDPVLDGLTNLKRSAARINTAKDST